MPKPRFGRDWLPIRRQVLKRDGYQCVECGSRQRLEVDHIKPASESGTDDLANLQTLCRDCHIFKTRAEKDIQWLGSSEWLAFAHSSRFKKNRPGGAS